MRFILVLVLFFATQASACINTYEKDLLILMQQGDPDVLVYTIRRLETENTKRPTIQGANDLAVAYILSGAYGKAVKLLKRLEKNNPGIPMTASNLGTALELSGNNEEALHWIKEGVVRNAKDHEDTEWLHVKILEAKVALQKDPAWLDSRSVLGVDFGRALRPERPSILPVDQFDKTRSWEDVEKAMDYQLKERLKFVKAPDLIVASLFQSRADIAYLQKSPHAPDYYVAARFFGAKEADLLDRRVKQFQADNPAEHSEPARAVEDFMGNLVVYGMILGVLVLAAVMVSYFVRRPSPENYPPSD